MLLRRRVWVTSARFCSASAVKRDARLTIAGVDLDLFAGLGVFQRDDADVRQRLFAQVVDPHRDEIVSPARDGQRARKIFRLKIRDEENNRAAGDDVIQIIEREARDRCRGPSARKTESRGSAAACASGLSSAG